MMSRIPHNDGRPIQNKLAQTGSVFTYIAFLTIFTTAYIRHTSAALLYLSEHFERWELGFLIFLSFIFLVALLSYCSFIAPSIVPCSMHMLLLLPLSTLSLPDRLNTFGSALAGYSLGEISFQSRRSACDC